MADQKRTRTIHWVHHAATTDMPANACGAPLWQTASVTYAHVVTCRACKATDAYKAMVVEEALGGNRV